MYVAILAGGRGTRLQSVVQKKPKVLATVRRRPFLSYILDQLHAAHFQNVVLCTGFHGDHIKKMFGRTYKNLRLAYSQESKPLGTAGSLRLALPLLLSDIILVMNGDSFCPIDFKKLWFFHTRKKSKATVVLSNVSDTSRFGSVILGKQNDIIAFEEKKRTSEPSYVNAGIYLVNKGFIGDIPVGKKMSLEKHIFPKWIGRGLYGYKTKIPFIDIGTAESYAQSPQFFS